MHGFTTAQRFTLSLGGTTNTRIHMVKLNYVHANGYGYVLPCDNCIRVSVKCMTHGDTTEFLNAPSLRKRHLMQHEKIRQKEFLVRSMTHGDPTEFTHALSLEKENENERLPKRLHHLRFLSTTRINHAGLLFGKHGILLSHT